MKFLFLGYWTTENELCTRFSLRKINFKYFFYRTLSQTKAELILVYVLVLVLNEGRKTPKVLFHVTTKTKAHPTCFLTCNILYYSHTLTNTFVTVSTFTKMFLKFQIPRAHQAQTAKRALSRYAR